MVIQEAIDLLNNISCVIGLRAASAIYVPDPSLAIVFFNFSINNVRNAAVQQKCLKALLHRVLRECTERGWRCRLKNDEMLFMVKGLAEAANDGLR